MDSFLQALEERRLKREAERMAMAKRTSQINAEADADAVAKRVYLETQNAPAPEIPPKAVPNSLEAAPPPTHPAHAKAEKPMVKDMIILMLKEAYPKGLTAAQIKAKAFLRFQEHINPNTLTVTLGRYSKPKDGEPRLARFEGRVWFYVREREERETRAMVQGAIDILKGRHVDPAEKNSGERRL